VKQIGGAPSNANASDPLLPCVDEDPLLCDPHAYSSTTSTAVIGGR